MNLNPITMQLVADKYIRLALEEDIHSEDVSTNAVMPEYKAGEVELICKQDGVIAGLPVFERVFTMLDASTKVEWAKNQDGREVKDGDAVKKGQLLATVKGDVRVLLSGERTALNYLQRLSGIATYTHQVARLLEGSSTTLLDTRKTTPCMRIFEKYAVCVGGGQNHRYNLSDGVLLKDNHIDAAGGVKEAILAAKAYAPFVRKIEVETENLDMAAVCIIITSLILKKTALGLYVQSVGINKKASRIAGIKSERIIFLCYIVCGLCAGIAGIVASSRISSADSNNIGLNFELDAILAVALGGNSLGGGKFRLTGSIIGAYTIQAITTTLYALGVSTEQAPVYKAVIVIIIVAIQAPPFKDYMKKMSAKRQLAKGGVA